MNSDGTPPTSSTKTAEDHEPSDISVPPSPPAKKKRGRPVGSKTRVYVPETRKDLPGRSCRRSSLPSEVVIPSPPITGTCKKFLMSDWTLSERQKLLSAIKVHSYSNYEALAKYVPGKTPEEIQWFITRVKKHRSNEVDEAISGHQKAPIEGWLSMCENIVRFEKDHSNVLSSIMQVAGQLEPHHPPYNQQKEPNYTKIYEYLSRLLHKDPPSELSPIDSAVVLDLLQSTVDILCNTNVEAEREMMKEKYRIFSATRCEFSSLAMRPDVQKALGLNDPEPDVESIREQVKTVRNNSGSQRQAPSASEAIASTSHGDNGTSGDPTPGTSSGSTRLDPLLDNINCSRPELVYAKPCTRRPGRPKTSNGQNPSPEKVGADSNATSGSSTADIPGSSTAVPGSSTAVPGSSTAVPGSSTAGVQRRPTCTGAKPSRLLSINPFCIDVKYLKVINTDNSS